MRRDRIALALFCVCGLATLSSVRAYAQATSNFEGQFAGTYQCAQGSSDVTITVLPEGRTARFAFSGHGVEGSYIVAVRPLGNASYDLVPLRWERAPRNYGMVGSRVTLQGNSLSGRIANPSCGAIRANRIGDDVRQARPTSPASVSARDAREGDDTTPRLSDLRGLRAPDFPSASIFLSCRAGTSGAAAESTASLTGYRKGLELSAQQAGQLLSKMRDPDALRRQISEARQSIALTPYEQQQFDVANAEVRRLQARGAFPLAARVKERNDRVLAQIFNTTQRRAAQQRLQDAEAQLEAQGAMAGQIRAVQQAYDQARAQYEQAIRALYLQPVTIRSLAGYLALERDVALLSICRTSAGADSTDVTLQGLAALADPIVAELDRSVSDALATAKDSAALARALNQYRASRALRINLRSAAAIMRADAAFAALQRKELEARQLAESRAAAARRAAAEAEARAYLSSDRGRLSNAAAAAYFRAPSLTLARGLKMVSLNQNAIDAIVGKYVFDTKTESCSKSARGTLCSYELQVTLASVFTISSPWVKRTDLFVNDGGSFRSDTLDAAMATIAAASPSSGGSAVDFADERNQQREKCRMQNFGDAMSGEKGGVMAWAMC